MPFAMVFNVVSRAVTDPIHDVRLLIEKPPQAYPCKLPGGYCRASGSDTPDVPSGVADSPAIRSAYRISWFLVS